MSVGIEKSSISVVLLSVSKDAISSRSIEDNSSAFKYLSRATRSSMRSIIFIVVATPTSDDIRISSNSSNTLSST